MPLTPAIARALATIMERWQPCPRVFWRCRYCARHLHAHKAVRAPQGASNHCDEMVLRGGTAPAASRRAAQSGAQLRPPGPVVTRTARSARAEWSQRDHSHHQMGTCPLCSGRIPKCALTPPFPLLLSPLRFRGNRTRIGPLTHRVSHFRIPQHTDEIMARATKSTKSPNYVYAWGNKKADGNGSMKALLGGKGANLAEMTRIGLPVPPGFTITTE